MEPAPAAPLIMPQSEFLLELLVVALDAPAQLGQRDEAVEGDVLGKGGEPVFRRPLLLRRPLDQQPFLRAGFAKMIVAMRVLPRPQGVEDGPVPSPGQGSEGAV